jgi:hypothetical protein
MDQRAIEAPPAVDCGESGEIRECDPKEQGRAASSPVLPGWHCVPQAVLRAHGEEGPIDLVALREERGAALIALLEPGEEASPEEARAAFCAMLADEGFVERFGAELPVVALALPRGEDVAAAVEGAFAPLPQPALAEGWIDWLAERLAPRRSDAAIAMPRLLATPLVAPPRDETMPPRAENAPPLLVEARDETVPAPDAPLRAPSREEMTPESAGPDELLPRPMRDEAVAVARVSEGALASGEEAPPHSVLVTTPPGWLDWGASLGFAIAIVLVLLIGLALFSRSGRLF